MSLPLREAVVGALTASGPEEARAQRLFAELRSVTPAEREEALTTVATALAGHDPRGGLLRYLAGAPDVSARLLALELAARLPTADRSLLSVIRPLLQDRTLPIGAQFAAVVVLLQTTGKSGPAAVELIRSFVTGLDKTQIQERLDALQQRLGKIPALEEMRSRLEAKLSQRCPRCGEQLQRPDMAGHLWQAHGLVLDGPFVREPWSLIEDWVSEAAEKNNPDLLARCFELAQHADPEHGLARLERSLRSRGIATDGSPRRTDQAVTATVCPHCGTALREPKELPVLRLNVSHGRLSAGGYLVEVSETGLRPRLIIETPEEAVCDGPEPGQRWTGRGELLVWVAPPLLLGFLAALFLPRPEAAVGVSFLAALLAFLLVGFRWYVGDAALDRAVDHAWFLLAPKFHADGFSADDSAFLAGLAEASGSHGRPHQRERALESATSLTETALNSRPEVLGHLASLWRLAIADGARLGRDPVLLAARQIHRCLSGALPLTFADRLLTGWQSDWLTTGNRARLRILVCRQAFESDLGVADLLEAGRLAPGFGQMLAVQHADDLAALRHLWSLKTSQPWERCGEAFTVFDLAEQAGLACRLLEQCPDLLLYQFLGGAEHAERGLEALLICPRGVVFGGKLINHVKQAHELPIRADRVTAWLAYLSEQFLPQNKLGRNQTAQAGKFRILDANVCPGCGRSGMPSPVEKWW
jgi:uncharacterized C2H2 Zn-finger protein